MSGLLTTPFSIVNSDKDVRKSLDAATKIAQYLVENPHDYYVRSILIDQLESLDSKFTWIANLARDARFNIEKFGDDIPRIAGDLERTAKTAMDGSKADASKVAEYQKKVSDLNIMLTAAYVGLAAEIAAEIMMLTFAAMAIFPTNLFFALVAALDLVAIEITKKRIAEIKAEIEYDYKQMDKMTQDMALLNACSTTFSTLANDTKALQDKVTAIWVEWAKLGEETAAALTSIKQAIANVPSDYFFNFQGVVTSLQEAAKDWDDLMAQANSLELDMVFSDAEIPADATPDQIRNLLANSQKVPYLDHINRVSMPLTAA